MNKTERILSLLAFLLSKKRPISYEEIVAEFPDEYGVGSTETANRKFERDKSDLSEFGVPIKFVKNIDDENDGYVVDRESFFLAPIDFLPEERTLLSLIATLSKKEENFPMAARLALALTKLNYSGEPTKTCDRDNQQRAFRYSLPDSAPCEREIFELAISSAAERRPLEIEYHPILRPDSTRRVIEPYGIIYRDSFWLLIGYCRLREKVRRFRLDRISTARPAGEPDSFRPKAEFNLSDYTDEPTWEWEVGEKPIKIELKLDPQNRWWIERLFTRNQPVSDEASEQVVINANNPDGLLATVIEIGGAARITGGSDASNRLNDLLVQVSEYYEDPSS